MAKTKTSKKPKTKGNGGKAKKGKSSRAQNGFDAVGGSTATAARPDVATPDVKADMIVVLDKGEIKEMGTHDELLAKQGFYYQLHKMQFQKQEATI